MSMGKSGRYRTKLGKQASYILLGQTGVVFAAASFWSNGVWPMVVLSAIVLCLAAWMMLGTRYVIDRTFLYAHCGPFRLRVPLAAITAVHRRAMDRGVTFALASDLIGIEYGANALNVSPRDADGFIKAVHKATQSRRPDGRNSA